MKKLTALLFAVTLALALPAQAVTYYLVPQPYTQICEPGEYLSVYRILPQTEGGHGGTLSFQCFFGHNFHKHYVALEVSLQDAGTVFVQPRFGTWEQNDGWFRVTYNIVPGTADATENGREF